MNKSHFQKLQTKIAPFSRINFFQYSDFSKNEPTGVFCSAYSEGGKEYVMERVREVITNLKLHFTVSDEGLFNTHHFVIRF